jgi:hypothetical protein
MPKRKITLDEAFAVFERHGLQVEVRAVKDDTPTEQLSAFLEVEEGEQPTTEELSNKWIKVTLFAAHTVGSGGSITVMPDGSRQVINNGIQTYGPGIVTIPANIATHLLHQDMLARRADDRMLESRVRQYVVVPRRTVNGTINCARHLSNDASFDMSGFLGKLGDNEIYLT